jgi:hypothetical protein
MSVLGRPLDSVDPSLLPEIMKTHLKHQFTEGQVRLKLIKVTK